MHIIIDRPHCVSCGTCWDTCPGIFMQNPDDSFSEIIAKYQTSGDSAEGDIPKEEEACALDAVSLCPAQVIRNSDK